MASNKRLRIKKDALLLVEGKDEENLLKGLLKSRINDQQVRSKIQIIQAGGKDQFPNRFSAIDAQLSGRKEVSSIGIVRDADASAHSAFESICNVIRSHGYIPPSNHASFSDGNPSIGIFISPDGTSPGAIEALCRRSVEGDTLSECVSEYMGCLRSRRALHSTDADKSFAHAYLAAQKDPVSRVGEAALQGIWNFESDVFDSLLRFVGSLISPRPRTG